MIAKWYRRGLTQRGIARELGCSQSLVMRRLRELGVVARPNNRLSKAGVCVDCGGVSLPNRLRCWRDWKRRRAEHSRNWKRRRDGIPRERWRLGF